MSDDFSAALARLPHGMEFRFIDQVLSLEPGIRGTGVYRVRGDEPFLRGHFPGSPLFPGVLLLEGAAQLAGVVAQSDPAIPPLPGLKLAAIRSAKILGSARPGETVAFSARITTRLGTLIQSAVSAAIDGAVILQAEVTLAGNVAS
jgi:3-hydroxyacyl-[acyl-carrier-protein] dehydratase